MSYKPALWDESDSLYAPHTARTKDLLYWKPTKRYTEAGFPAAPRRLPGRLGDGNELERARLAREYTREMLLFLESPAPKVVPGSWKHLIGRYLNDNYSPFHELKGNTQAEYLRNIGRWEAAVGTSLVRDTTFEVARSWQKAMATNGRSIAYQKRQFTMLRILAGYGAAIVFDGGEAVKNVLSGMRIKSPKPRDVAPTKTEVYAVISAADEAGDAMFALGLSLQWWLTLRAVDVRGQWLPGSEGGIVRGGHYWTDGLTWDMISSDLSSIRKAPSKTKDVLPQPLVYDLIPLVDLRQRLSKIPKLQRVGPVIVQKNGMPYTKRHWATLFARYRKAAGVSEDILCMDIRAGAITEAVELGASEIEAQHQANHTQPSTTARYVRRRSKSMNKVIRMRSGGTGSER